MTTSSQKESELAALELVYPASRSRATPSEAPDFLVDAAGGRFGVEVTELYSSGSEARLHNSTDYVVHLLNGGDPRHKDDEHLRLQPIEVLRGGDGSRVPAHAVIASVPSAAAHASLVADAVSAKHEKAYAEGLLFLDLIIDDRTRSLGVVERDRVVELLLGEELVRRITSARFREVFLVTRCRPATRIVVPLKGSALMREALVFLHASKELAGRDCEFPQAPAPEVIAAYCRRRGLSTARFEHEQTVHVMFGSASVAVSEARPVEFGIFPDHLPPAAPFEPSQDLDLLCEPLFAEIDAWATKWIVPVMPAVVSDEQR